MSENHATDAQDGTLAPIAGAPAKARHGESQNRGRIGPAVSEDRPSPLPPAEFPAVSQTSADDESVDAAADDPPALAPIPAGVEIELKLLTDREHLAALQKAPAIEANARNRGVHRHLIAIYYDTPGRRLRKAGFVLRVRRSGSRFTQTVKTDGPGDGLRRGEWETPVSDMSPDLQWVLPLLPEKLARKVTADALVPVFSTDVHRLVRMVSLPSGQVEVAFDHGTLDRGRTHRPPLRSRTGAQGRRAADPPRIRPPSPRARPAPALGGHQGGPRIRPRRRPGARHRRRPRRSRSNPMHRSTRPSPSFSAARSTISSRRCRPPRTAAIRKAFTRRGWGSAGSARCSG